MPQLIDIKVPDIGDFKDIPIIDVLVKPGDTIAVDGSLCTLESDKATMDVPSSAAGLVKEVLMKVGDKVSQGSVIARVEAAGETATVQPAPSQAAPAAAPLLSLARFGGCAGL
jgi:pyruvate/2-oxoglutarate dehydrogenase complex dihydrolipoamide acyltransferase (E2) component